MAQFDTRHRRPATLRDLSETGLTVDEFLRTKLLLNAACSVVNINGNRLGLIEKNHQRVQNQEGFGRQWESHEDFHIGNVQRILVANNGLRFIQLQLLPQTLCVLNLSDNILTCIPDEIQYLTGLKELKCHRNELESISDRIGCLSKLETLLLSKNNLKYLPESIGKCTALKFLGLSSNVLTNLPMSMVNLDHLETLDIALNMFPEPPLVLGFMRQRLKTCTLESFQLGVDRGATIWGTDVYVHQAQESVFRKARWKPKHHMLFVGSHFSRFHNIRTTAPNTGRCADDVVHTVLLAAARAASSKVLPWIPNDCWLHVLGFLTGTDFMPLIRPRIPRRRATRKQRKKSRPRRQPFQ
eukprot:m.856546 g.856546  ORF g.856546 m.856546 type:complete len:355 (+) comp23514_c0_seq2:2862-3926(+)